MHEVLISVRLLRVEQVNLAFYASHTIISIHLVASLLSSSYDLRIEHNHSHQFQSS